MIVFFVFPYHYSINRDDPAPAPWTPEGQRRMEEGGYAEMVKPAGHDEYLKVKAQEQEEKLAKKLAEKGEAKERGVAYFTRVAKCTFTTEAKGMDIAPTQRAKDTDVERIHVTGTTNS